MLHLDHAKAPAIERSEMTQYYNIGLFLIDSIPELWRSPNAAFIHAQLLKEIYYVG